MSYLDVILTVKIRDGHKCRPMLQVSRDASFYTSITEHSARISFSFLFMSYE